MNDNLYLDSTQRIVGDAVVPRDKTIQEEAKAEKADLIEQLKPAAKIITDIVEAAIAEAEGFASYIEAFEGKTPKDDEIMHEYRARQLYITKLRRLNALVSSALTKEGKQ